MRAAFNFFRLFAALVISWVLATQLPARAQSIEVDLELVLAMDGSGSINDEEFALQLQGTAKAFRDPALQNAILSGPIGSIAVSILIWSDAAFPKFKSKWYLINSTQSADDFGKAVLSLYRRTGRKYGIGGGGTGIGDGVRVAIEMIEENQFIGLRRTVDVSGDGIETTPWFKEAIMLPGAKKLAQFSNVTVNGLAILTDFPRLDEWYRENVITGPGAFVIRANTFEHFEDAIHEKLWREISHTISKRPSVPEVPLQSQIKHAGLLKTKSD